MEISLPRYARPHTMQQILILWYLYDITLIYMRKLHRKFLFRFPAQFWPPFTTMWIAVAVASDIFFIV